MHGFYSDPSEMSVPRLCMGRLELKECTFLAWTVGFGEVYPAQRGKLPEKPYKNGGLHNGTRRIL